MGTKNLKKTATTKDENSIKFINKKFFCSIMKLQQVSSLEMIKFLKIKGYQIHHSKESHFVLIKINVSRIVVPFRNKLALGTTLAILSEAKITKEEYTSFFSRKW